MAQIDELELYLDELATQHLSQARMLEILSRVNSLVLADPPNFYHTVEKKYDVEYEHQLLEKLRAVESLRQKLQQQNESMRQQLQLLQWDVMQLIENFAIWWYSIEYQQRFLEEERREIALASAMEVIKEKRQQRLMRDNIPEHAQPIPMSSPPPVPAPRLELFAMKRRLYPY